MREAEAYARHKNLKLAASELGVPFQALYARLRADGVSVSGDKARYGRETDKFAAAAERDFARLVPAAINHNSSQWQASVDFDIDGISVDVKASRPGARNKRNGPALSWAFCVRRQASKCGFFCCMCYSAGQVLQHILLLPADVVGNRQLITVPCSGNSKWMKFEVQPHELAPFFAELSATTSAQAA